MRFADVSFTSVFYNNEHDENFLFHFIESCSERIPTRREKGQDFSCGKVDQHSSGRDETPNDLEKTPLIFFKNSIFAFDHHVSFTTFPSFHLNFGSAFTHETPSRPSFGHYNHKIINK